MTDYGFGVSLRRIDPSDAQLLYNWRNNYDIYKWCRQIGPLHLSRHLKWIEAQSQDASQAMFIISNRGMSVGVCGLTSIDLINARAEFSCYVGREHQGKGYGYKALKTLFKHGFEDLRLNRIWGETFDKNPAISMFTKLGLELEGTRKEFYYRAGSFVDCHLLSIGRERFNQLHDSDEALKKPYAGDQISTGESYVQPHPI